MLTCLGLLGNIASIIVLRSPGLDMKVSFIFCFWYFFAHPTLYQITFRQILMMLAMFDSMFIICMTVSFSLPKLIPAYRYCMFGQCWICWILQLNTNPQIFGKKCIRDSLTFAILQCFKIICINQWISNQHEYLDLKFIILWYFVTHKFIMKTEWNKGWSHGCAFFEIRI